MCKLRKSEAHKLDFMYETELEGAHQVHLSISGPTDQGYGPQLSQIPQCTWCGHWDASTVLLCIYSFV